MKSTHELTSITDDELLRRLVELLRQSRRAEADLVAHVGEVDARRLYAREASPSMFAYCTEVLHLSEAEAYLRIAAARASREHPMLLSMLADGRLHLTAIAKLAPHLTPANREALLQRATHKSKREIEELVAELVPRPDAPALMRKLPACRVLTSPATALRPDPDGVTPLAPPAPLCLDRVAAALELRPDGVATHEPELRPDAVAAPELERPRDGAAQIGPELRWVGDRTPRSAAVEPLAPARYRVQFTASVELHDKLERLRALMRSSIPDGDLAAIIEKAVTEKLERLESRRFGQTRVPRKVLAGKGSSAAGKGSPPAKSGSPATRHIPAAVKRAVYERDGGRCRYVDGAHNRHIAEVDYGRTAMALHRRSRKHASEAAPPPSP